MDNRQCNSEGCENTVRSTRPSHVMFCDECLKEKSCNATIETQLPLCRTQF